VLFGGSPPNSYESPPSQFQCSHYFSSEQQELPRREAVELTFSRRHFGAIWAADGARMREKAEVPLDTAIISTGVVAVKSVVVAR
jgi:hypothetical protein